MEGFIVLALYFIYEEIKLIRKSLEKMAFPEGEDKDE